MVGCVPMTGKVLRSSKKMSRQMKGHGRTLEATMAVEGEVKDTSQQVCDSAVDEHWMAGMSSG